MSEIFAELMKRRGIDESFLHPQYDDAADPFELPDMELAVERLARAVERKEKVLIYGDYDVDGVTAATVMYDTLKLIGLAQVGVMLPNRFEDGYGMSEKILERVKTEGIGLVVTVDCGTANGGIIEKLSEMGVETIVTDHHECGSVLPKAVAVVNPKRQVENEAVLVETGLKNLAGVGVAFELARALMLSGMLPEGQEKWLLDLVVIGTICDAMRLSRENRILTYWGMRVLAKTRRQGLRELMRVAKVTKLDTDAIAFRIGPRLNAAGRVDSAMTALKLLMTKDVTEAARLAQVLEGLNAKRRDLQVQAATEIRKNGVPDDKVLVLTGIWPEGVLGIIAGKMVEEYKRPAFVLSKIDGVWKGSGRSFGEFNLAEALKACADCIIGGGGHAEACGLKVENDKLELFRTEVNKYYEGLKLEKQERFLKAVEDMAVEGLKNFNLELMAELNELQPYGEGNMEPRFLLKSMEVLEARKMGKQQQHLSLLLSGQDGGRMRLVAWSAAQEWLNLRPGEEVSAVVRLAENEFRGMRNVEGEMLELVG